MDQQMLTSLEIGLRNLQSPINPRCLLKKSHSMLHLASPHNTNVHVFEVNNEFGIGIEQGGSGVWIIELSNLTCRKIV